MSGTRVVVTGAAGKVGDALLRLLDERFDVSGVDLRRPAQPLAHRPVRRLDVRRRWAARRAVRGADTVVHLAVGASMSASWTRVQVRNVRMTWEVLEAAASLGVRRVILASSNHVVGGYEADEPYRSVLAGDGAALTTVTRLDADAPPRPDSPYGVGKLLDESAGRYFADQRGLSVIALRIGTVRPGDRPEEVRHLATFLSHRDLAQLVGRCIDAPASLRFAVFYGVSDNTRRIWDIEAARQALGYAPLDDAEKLQSGLA